MFRWLFMVVISSAMISFGAQGSGVYVEGEVNRGVHSGDTMVAGFLTLSTVYYQYCVEEAFTLGYEHSFSKTISIRGGVGYRYALLDAYGGTIQTNGTEKAEVSKEIDRHWLTIPVDFKVTLPIRRSGLYLTAGPKFSFLLSSTYKDSIAGTSLNVSKTTPRFNLSLGGTIGFEIAIAKFGYLLLESGYHHAVTNTSMYVGKKAMESDITLLGVGFRLNVPSKQE